MIIRDLKFKLSAIILGVMFPLWALCNPALDSKDAPLSAEQIMIKVDERDDGATRSQTGILTLIDKKGNRRVREFREYSKKYGLDEKRISHVISPPEVRNTSLMAYEWKERDREDETWLYLPQLRKVKRLASTDKSGYFLGSDFTYGDFIGLEVADFHYEYDTAEPNKGGIIVIVATPKEDIAPRVIEETGYNKVKYWIDSEKFLIVKAQYWLQEGQRIKYYSASDIEQISGIWTVKKMQMITTQGGTIVHSSIFQLNDIEINIPIDDKAFTTYAMEREAS